MAMEYDIEEFGKMVSRFLVDVKRQLVVNEQMIMNQAAKIEELEKCSTRGIGQGED